MVCRHCPSGRQVRTVLSSLAEAMRLPSSLHAALYTKAVWPTSSAIQSPWNVQTRKVWSCEAETTPIWFSNARPLQIYYINVSHTQGAESCDAQEDFHDKCSLSNMRRTVEQCVFHACCG